MESEGRGSFPARARSRVPVHAGLYDKVRAHVLAPSPQCLPCLWDRDRQRTLRGQGMAFGLEIGSVSLQVAKFSLVHATGQISFSYCKYWRQGAPEAPLLLRREGGFSPAVPSRCQHSPGEEAKLLLRSPRLLILAAACGVHPQRNLFSLPSAGSLTRGFVKHSDTTCALCFGPGGVKRSKEKRQLLAWQAPAFPRLQPCLLRLCLQTRGSGSLLIFLPDYEPFSLAPWGTAGSAWLPSSFPLTCVRGEGLKAAAAFATEGQPQWYPQCSITCRGRDGGHSPCQVPLGNALGGPSPCPCH